MKNVKLKLHDKSGWPEGPWKHEPDVLYWPDAKIAKLISRHEWKGSLHGYVIVPKGHHYHGRPVRSLQHIDVHGRVTFSGEVTCLPHIEPLGLDPDDWAIGFDCGHPFDLSPGFECNTGIALPGAGVYRDIDFVGRELDSLASQLSAKVILTLTVNQGKK